MTMNLNPSGKNIFGGGDMFKVGSMDSTMQHGGARNTHNPMSAASFDPMSGDDRSQLDALSTVTGGGGMRPSSYRNYVLAHHVNVDDAEMEFQLNKYKASLSTSYADINDVVAGRTLLDQALYDLQESVAIYLLVHPDFAGVNHRDAVTGTTALITAMEKNLFLVAELVLKHPGFTNVNSRTKFGSSAYFLAFSTGNRDILRKIKEHPSFKK